MHTSDQANRRQVNRLISRTGERVVNRQLRSQALRQRLEGRPVPQVRVALEVTRGGSACGPPPEPDARVTAPTRTACASWGVSSTATQLVSCSYQRLVHCTYCTCVCIQLCYILHILCSYVCIQLCLHTTLRHCCV